MQLDGSFADEMASGLTLMADGCHIKGLAITHWNDGVSVYSNNNEIDHNLIGVRTTGAGLDTAGNVFGIDILTTSGNTIHDNVIGGNFFGVIIVGSLATQNTIHDNKIGTDAGEATALPNNIGVHIEGGASGNTILHNTISWNNDEGVWLSDYGTTNNVVKENQIGTNTAGNKGLPNTDGVVINGGASGNTVVGNTIAGNKGTGVIFGQGTGNALLQNRIVFNKKGAQVTAGAVADLIQGNEIGANTFYGIEMHHAAGIQIVGNFIGVDSTYLHKMPNQVGIEITDQSSSNLIKGNAIFFSELFGVDINGDGTSNNTVIGNGIELNGYSGVFVGGGASNNWIGGTAAGEGNWIYGNARAGVWVGNSLLDPTSGNAVLGNTIFANDGPGIDLIGDGPTPNAPSNPVAGAPNGLQNYPKLRYAISDSNGLTVAGDLHSAPFSTYRVEFFANPGGGDQGMVYLGFLDVSTDFAGNAHFLHTFSPGPWAPPGTTVTATATDKERHNTSEFSAPVVVEAYRAMRVSPPLGGLDALFGMLSRQSAMAMELVPRTSFGAGDMRLMPVVGGRQSSGDMGKGHQEEHMPQRKGRAGAGATTAGLDDWLDRLPQ